MRQCEVFILNPAIRKIFEVEQETMTFDSMEKQKENLEFYDLFKDVANSSKVAKEADIVLQVPIRETKRFLHIKLLPIKDKNENVKIILIFVNEK